MDNKKIASELVKLAKTMIGGTEDDIGGVLRMMIKQIAEQTHHQQLDWKEVSKVTKLLQAAADEAYTLSVLHHIELEINTNKF